jgi:hypothetical protein
VLSDAGSALRTKAAKECTVVGETTKAIAQTEKACQVPLVHLLRGFEEE